MVVKKRIQAGGNEKSPKLMACLLATPGKDYLIKNRMMEKSTWLKACSQFWYSSQLI